ncbi:MAG: hypothetical protein IMY72_00230 [Bacteroidetes bacterium]|nr:hypothetical protein [Bacteroidota bacterium]
MEKLELHYYLENESHAMDAFVKNKAESEVLKILTEVSELLELDLSFELEAIQEGGIREFIKFLSKKKNRKKILPILTFIGGILSVVIADVSSDYLKKDKEYENLKKEEIKLNIRKLKQELEEDNLSENDTTVIINNIVLVLSNSDKVKFHKSNFYSTLLKESKIEKISTTELDENYNPISKENIVLRENFRSFIIESNKVESEIIDNATIEIVSPVFKAGKTKWKGFYDSRSFSFSLNDQEFKKSVLNKEYSFTSGTMLKCTLEVEKEMDNEGDIKITGYNVFDVQSVFEGESFKPTKRAKREIEDKRQLSMNFEDE